MAPMSQTVDALVYEPRNRPFRWNSSYNIVKDFKNIYLYSSKTFLDGFDVAL